MAELPQQILIEQENVDETLKNLRDVLSRKERSFVELAAIGTCLHNFYNGIENILKQSLGASAIKIPRGETWHKDLLKLSSSNGIISDAVRDKLFEYLTFRHYFVHSYSFMLQQNQLDVLVNNAPGIWMQFISGVTAYFLNKTD